MPVSIRRALRRHGVCSLCCETDTMVAAPLTLDIYPRHYAPKRVDANNPDNFRVPMLCVFMQRRRDTPDYLALTLSLISWMLWRQLYNRRKELSRQAVCFYPTRVYDNAGWQKDNFCLITQYGAWKASQEGRPAVHNRWKRGNALLPVIYTDLIPQTFIEVLRYQGHRHLFYTMADALLKRNYSVYMEFMAQSWTTGAIASTKEC